MKYLTLLLPALLCAASLGAQTVTNSFFVGGFAGGLEYDPATDTIWVADETGDTINQYSRTGALLQSFAAPIPPNSSATNPLPIGVGIDPATGNLWIGDEAEFVYEFTATGNTTGISWSTSPSVTDVSGADVDPVTGNVFISQDSGGTKIVEFTQAGVMVRSISVSGAGSTDPDGLGYNPSTTTFYLGEDAGNRIIEVDQLGSFVNSWDMGALGISPEGVGVDTINGQLFIADGSGGTVWEIGGIVVGGGGGPRLSIQGLTAGATTTITVSSATPNGLVGIGYSIAGPGPTTTNVPPCGSQTVALSNPIKILPILTASANGVASVTANVPPGTTGVSVWLHALDVGSCTLTNPLAEVIG